MPFGDFLVEAGLSGLYIDYDEFEGYAVEGDLSVTWRPYRYFGVVGGYRAIAMDVDHGRNNYDVTFHGPYLGHEVRYLRRLNPRRRFDQNRCRRRRDTRQCLRMSCSSRTRGS